MTTVGEQLIPWLEAYDIDTIFGIPGVHTVELYRGLEGSTIRHITPRHEQGAGFMADGYARSTGKVAACFIITGPGMTNIATAMAQAYADSIPMLVISSTNRVGELGSGDGRLHELPSQNQLISGVTEFSHTLLTPNELPQVLARAFSVFYSARPRPVHIEIPIDIIAQPVDDEKHHRLFAVKPVAPPSRPAPCPAALEQAAQKLCTANRPLLLLGGGCIDTGSTALDVAESLGAIVALTNNAKGIIPPAHPLLLGSCQSLQPARELMQTADVILAIGTELGETDYDVFFNGGFSLNGELIRVDIDHQQLMRNFIPDLAIVSDACLFLQALQKYLKHHHTDKAYIANIYATQTDAVNQVKTVIDTQKGAQHHLHDQVLNCLKDNLHEVILVGDSTQVIYSGHLSYESPNPRSWFHSATGYGTLGYGIPAAIGAKTGQSNRTVVAITGDGGAQFTLPELACAVEFNVPVIILLWNNQGYSEIKKYMANNNIPQIGVDIYTPDFIQLTEGFGGKAFRADNLKQLSELLHHICHESDLNGPVLIELDEQTLLSSLNHSRQDQNH